jgi:3-deoxy-7-phosphoheptulonate synthase
MYVHPKQALERNFFMIIRMSDEAGGEERAQLLALLRNITGTQRPISTTRLDEREVIVLDGSQVDEQACKLLRQHEAVESVLSVKTAYQLVNRAFKPGGSRIVVGDALGGNPVTIGTDGADGGTMALPAPVIIGGPCAVEGREQLLAIARSVRDAGAQILRGLPVITEVMEPELVETVASYADILQIGSRNMQNFPLLLAVGCNRKKRPVMLKRGFAATIDEWLLAAEYIMAAGNPNVILCERGIRSFDSHTRNVLDLACVPLLHELTHLPVIVDPSHATGRRELVPTMSRAAIAAGADGLILEVHPDPNSALCDGRQSITAEQLSVIVREARVISEMMYRTSGLSQVA